MGNIILAILVISSLTMAESTVQTNIKLNTKSKLQAVCSKASMLEDIKQNGCRSWQGEVAGCSDTSVACNDIIYSSTCTKSIG